MPALKSPKTGVGLTTQSSLAVREARLARAYGEDRRARHAPPTAPRATKGDALQALRLNLGQGAETLRALPPKPARKHPDRPRSPHRRPLEPASASSDRAPTDVPTVTIRVLDDAKNTRREFVRELRPVLREMPYFRAHLAGRVDEAVLRETAATRSVRGPREAPRDASSSRLRRDRSRAALRDGRDENAVAARAVATPSRRRLTLTVRCDVEIFARLLAHVDETHRGTSHASSHAVSHASTRESPPHAALNVRDCVPVLVASEFLGMRALAETCLAFLASALPAALAARPGVGVETLGEATLARLAALVSEETLERAVAVVRGIEARGATEDETEKPNLALRALPSRLYALKLKTAYVGVGGGGDVSERTAVSRCVKCARVYPTSARASLVCARAEKRAVAFDGFVVAAHVPAKRFDAAAFVDALLSSHDPRHVYWYLWGATRVLPACARCGARSVAAAELNTCRYHQREAVVDREGTRKEGDDDNDNDEAGSPDVLSASPRSVRAFGVRPCCGARAPRFDAADALACGGCRRREHALARLRGTRSSPETVSVSATARRMRALVVEPDPSDPAAAAADANSVYRAGDHANAASLPLFGGVSGANAGSNAGANVGASLRSDGDGEGEGDARDGVTDAEVSGERPPRAAWPRGAFRRIAEETETRDAVSRRSRVFSGGSASDALERSSSDSASDDGIPTTASRESITANRAASSRGRLRETSSSTLSARAELSLSSLETHGHRSALKEAPDGSRSRVRGPRHQEHEADSCRDGHRARAPRSRTWATGTARAAEPSQPARRNPKEPKALASPSTFLFGLPQGEYDALPEKLRRALRRDALREADAARVAELERELRLLRRDESVALP